MRIQGGGPPTTPKSDQNSTSPDEKNRSTGRDDSAVGVTSPKDRLQGEFAKSQNSGAASQNEFAQHSIPAESNGVVDTANLGLNTAVSYGIVEGGCYAPNPPCDPEVEEGAEDGSVEISLEDELPVEEVIVGSKPDVVSRDGSDQRASNDFRKESFEGNDRIYSPAPAVGSGRGIDFSSMSIQSSTTDNSQLVRSEMNALMNLISGKNNAFRADSDSTGSDVAEIQS